MTDRDVLFARYEGLAVRAATRLWSAHGSSVRGSGSGLEDVVQQARLVLLEVVPKLDPAYKEGQSATYVFRSVYSRLLQIFVRSLSARRSGLNVNLGQFAIHVAEDRPVSAANPYILRGDASEVDRYLCELLADGCSVAAACRRVGLSRPQWRKARARIRKAMEDDGGRD